MKEQGYIVAFVQNSWTFTARRVTAPSAAVAIARSVIGMSPENVEKVGCGVIVRVNVYREVTVSEEADYAF